MSPHAGYLLQEEVVPRLASAIRNAVAFIGSEDAEELIQDGTAIAAKIMHNAELSGKHVGKSAGGPNKNAITAGNVAYYTIEKLSTLARTLGCWGSTLNKRKHRLAKAIAEFMGGRYFDPDSQAAGMERLPDCYPGTIGVPG
jgi:hypothetical protein